ncbi:hypothetical protein [Streptosporangium vulgare]|uniref:hypothetical protein n=1 Tax=Streptosporangium vulgare TaxID=46190 RepID=UPI0031D0AA91
MPLPHRHWTPCPRHDCRTSVGLAVAGSAYLLISAGMGPVAAGLVHLAYVRGVAVAVPPRWHWWWSRAIGWPRSRGGGLRPGDRVPARAQQGP